MGRRLRLDVEWRFFEYHGRRKRHVFDAFGRHRRVLSGKTAASEKAERSLAAGETFLSTPLTTESPTLSPTLQTHRSEDESIPEDFSNIESVFRLEAHPAEHKTQTKFEPITKFARAASG